MTLPYLVIDAPRRRVALDPRSPAFFSDPYPAYREIRSTTPVFFWENYGFWCFARHADVVSLLRDKRFGRQILHVATREELGWSEPPEHLEAFNSVERHSLLELEPPEHTRLRTLINRAFVSHQVERLAPRIASLAHELIDNFVRAGANDLLEHFAAPIPVIVIAELLGVPARMAPQLLDWSHCMVAMYQFGATREAEDRAATAAREFADFLRGYVRQRRATPSDDLISQLISAEADSGRLSEDEFIATCILVLNAGHEATVHGIANSAKALLEHRVDTREIFVTPQSRAMAVDELLRYDAPLHLFTRYALGDVDYAGVALKQGDKIGLMLGAANHDIERFADPDGLAFDRSPNPHVSFGGGIHFCVGASLARLEMEVALPILFERLPGLRLAEPLRYRNAYHFRGLERLLVGW